MNTVCHKQLHFGSFFGKEITVDFEGGRITSDGGALLLRELDEHHGLTETVATALDDPIHGHQQLSLFHGYYDEHMYHPLLVFDGLTGFPMVCVLRGGNTHASHGSVAVLRRMIKRLKRAYHSKLGSASP